MNITLEELEGLARLFRDNPNSDVTNQLKVIMTAQTELAKELRDMKEQNEKARKEAQNHNADMQQKMDELERKLDAANVVDPDLIAAKDELKASIQADDDQFPDAPAPAPAPDTGGVTGGEPT